MRGLVLLTMISCGRTIPPPDLIAPTEAPVPTESTLTVELRGGEIATGAPALIGARVSNPSLQDQEFCTYHTPFEGIRNHIFEVRSGEAVLPYRGMMAKRAPPTRADYRQLAPSRSTEWVEVDLREAYTLEPGVYTVRFLGGGISGLPDSAPVELTIR